LFVASGEDDGAGVVADEALGDDSGFDVMGRGRSRFVHDGVGGQDLGHQRVTVGSGFELIHFGEDGFSLGRFVDILLSGIG